MKCSSIRLLVLVVCVVAFPFRSPAPLIYTPGEGFRYEAVGEEGKWRRTQAKDQMAVAQQAFDRKDYSLALKAARRVVKTWPISDYAPQAQFMIAESYQAKGNAEKAFKEYQRLIEKNPKGNDYAKAIERQYAIADQYLAGKWFKLWGFIPYGSSMEKTAKMYDTIVKSGPFSDVAPQAQLKIGAAREKQKSYPLAVKAYELAADRYNDRPKIASEAIYRQGLAYHKQALRADYDQTTAGQAIATFTDFMTLYPDDPRVAKAQELINALRAEQAQGNYHIAKFYEKYHKWGGALVYYNEVQLRDPNSPYAIEAQQRMAELKQRISGAPAPAPDSAPAEKTPAPAEPAKVPAP